MHVFISFSVSLSNFVVKSENGRKCWCKKKTDARLGKLLKRLRFGMVFRDGPLLRCVRVDTVRCGNPAIVFSVACMK